MHVLLNCLRVELTFMRELTHHSSLDRIVDELRMLADQFATFCKFGVVHFLNSFWGDNATTLWPGMSSARCGPATLARANSTVGVPYALRPRINSREKGFVYGVVPGINRQARLTR